MTCLIALAWPESLSYETYPEADAYNFVVARALAAGTDTVVVEAASGYVGEHLETIAEMKAFSANDEDPPLTLADLVRDLKAAPTTPLRLAPYLNWHEAAPLVKTLIHPFDAALYSRVNKPRLVQPMTAVLGAGLRARLKRLRDGPAPKPRQRLHPSPAPEPADLALLQQELTGYETVYVCVGAGTSAWTRLWLANADSVIVFGSLSPKATDQLPALLKLASSVNDRLRALALSASADALVSSAVLKELALLARQFPLPELPVALRKQAAGGPSLAYSEPYGEAMAALAAAVG